MQGNVLHLSVCPHEDVCILVKGVSAPGYRGRGCLHLHPGSVPTSGSRGKGCLSLGLWGGGVCLWVQGGVSTSGSRGRECLPLGLGGVSATGFGGCLPLGPRVSTSWSEGLQSGVCLLSHLRMGFTAF